MMGISKKTCEKIIVLFQAGYSCTEIAKKFGLREGLIRNIVRGR